MREVTRAPGVHKKRIWRVKKSGEEMRRTVRKRSNGRVVIVWAVRRRWRRVRGMVAPEIGRLVDGRR